MRYIINRWRNYCSVERCYLILHTLTHLFLDHRPDDPVKFIAIKGIPNIRDAFHKQVAYIDGRLENQCAEKSRTTYNLSAAQ